VSAATTLGGELAEELRANDAPANDDGSAILSLPHGIHASVPDSVYHARRLGLASKSMLDRVRVSPKHYLEAVHGPARASTPAMVLGSALHCALFEPARFETSFSSEPVFGDCRKTDNKRARDEWRRANAGKTIVDSDDLRTVVSMCEALRAHPIAGRLLFGGEPEVTLRWQDSDTGLECKGRVDYLRRDRKLALDLKSTEDVRLDAFRKTVARFGYHRQEAMYRDAFAALGEPLEHFAFVAVEKTAPYDVAVYTLDLASVAKGRVTIREDLGRLADCIATDRWPGHSDEIQTLSLPDWAE
jgi:PDDEXK-like domain of unknown function (DUF3799)